MSQWRADGGEGEVMVPYVDIITGELFMMPKSELKRRPQKRPLGRLESDARFTPRQPVLSSRTLQDIDKSGSRTYRAKSSSAIIEEQHQLLHDVYLNSRTSRTSQAARRPVHGQNNHQQQVDLKRRRFLTINGTSTQRPWTSVERPKSVKKSDNKKKRPHTTLGRGSSSAARPATDTHLRIEPDAAIQASAHALQRCQRQVRDLWRPDSNRLDDGVFVRGRAGDLWEPRAAAWLNFTGGGGAGEEEDAGLVQAFTAAMKTRGDEYYTIDGTVGTQVARQLRRGDKVRVGINGNVQSTTLRVKRWRKDDYREDEGSADRLYDGDDDERPPLVPLCWDDQVVQTDAKVLEPRQASKPPPKKSLCESRPVIFERLLADDPLSKHMAALREVSGVNTGRPTAAAGYAVRSRTKSRVGIDGTTTQPMTSLTIEARAAAVVAADEDYMSVEDVLQHQLAGRDRKLIDRKRPELAISNLTDLKTHDDKAAPSKGRALRTPPTSARSVKPEVPSPPPSRAAAGTPWSLGGDGRSVRPLTAHSAHSIDQNFDSFVVTSAASTSGKPASARSGGRATSGKRPPPAKPTLHRSAAAMGASIGGNKGDTTSYIQITQSLTSPLSASQKEAAEARGQAQGIPPPTPASPDDLSMEGGGTPRDLDFSRDEFPELDSDLEEEEADPTTIEDDQPVEASVPSDAPQEAPPAPQEEPVQEEEEDVQYAFNIPTAEAVEEEDEEGAGGVDRAQILHDRLVEQTTDLLAGAIIGADLPPGLRRPPSGHRDTGPE